jgi:hypothetical protein
MKRLREALEIVLLVAFIGFILLLAYFTIHGARKVKALGDETTQTLADFRRTIVIAANAATDVQKGAEIWKKQSDEQSKQSTQALTNLNAAAKSLDSLITSTNSSLNVSLLPSLSRAIDDQNEALKKSEANIDAAVTVATATLADADKIVADPAIKASLDNLSAASKSTAETTKEAAASMAEVHEAINYEVKELEKPVKKIKVVWDFTLRSLGKFFGY